MDQSSSFLQWSWKRLETFSCNLCNPNIKQQPWKCYLLAKSGKQNEKVFSQAWICFMRSTLFCLDHSVKFSKHFKFGLKTIKWKCFIYLYLIIYIYIKMLSNMQHKSWSWSQIYVSCPDLYFFRRMLLKEKSFHKLRHCKI